MYVVKQVDEALAARAKIGRPSKRKWRGSLLGGCIRAHWYSANGVSPTEPFTPETLRVFAMGNAVGDFLQTVLKERYGDAIDFEVPVDDPENNFSGNIDALLRVSEDHLAVLEFKSIKHGGFTKLKKAKPEHATQVASYAWRVGQEHADHDVEVTVEAWVIYVDKDNYDLVEFPVDIDEWGGKANRILNVLNYYGDRIPPRFPDAGRRKWPCGWCNWRTECLGGAK